MLIFIEILSVAFNLLYLYFAIKRKPITWIFGIIASLLSVYLFYKIDYKGSAILNIIYAIQGIFGFMQWQFFQRNEGVAFKLSRKEHLFLIAFAVLLFLFLNIFIGNYFPSTVKKIDFLLALGCVLTTFIEIKKDIACWYYWIILNLAYTMLYSYQQLYLYAGMMLVLGVFSVWALFEWKKESQTTVEISTEYT